MINYKKVYPKKTVCAPLKRQANTIRPVPEKQAGGMQEEIAMDANTWVAQGNLVTTTPALDRPGRYQANGRFGAVWGPYGLHAPPAWQEVRRCYFALFFGYVFE